MIILNALIGHVEYHYLVNYLPLDDQLREFMLCIVEKML